MTLCQGSKSKDQLIFGYLVERLNSLKGKDKTSLYNEFKELLTERKTFQEGLWSIPDLTNERYKNFFLRAINQNH